MKAWHGSLKTGGFLKAARLAVVLAGACILILLAAVPALSQTTGVYTILDDATGGDCATIGSWDQYYRTCTLTADLVVNEITIGGDGITLDGAGHSITGSGAYGIYAEHRERITIKNTNIAGFSYAIFFAWTNNSLIAGNQVSGSEVENIALWGSSFNTIKSNTVSDNAWGDGVGIVGYSSANKVQYNDIYNNGWGVWINQAGTNTVVNNNFTNNMVQAEVAASHPNIFSLPDVGGNYWNNWTAPDADADGVVDSPYLLPGGQDDRPYAASSGWLCTRPGLSLIKSGARWASYADFLARQLSIDFNINSGLDAHNVTVVGSSSTNGVAMVTGTPVLLGNVTGGATLTATLKYAVQAGVNSFRTTTYATAADSCGKVYEYPGPYPGA